MNDEDRRAAAEARRLIEDALIPSDLATGADRRRPIEDPGRVISILVGFAAAMTRRHAAYVTEQNPDSPATASEYLDAFNQLVDDDEDVAG